MKRTNFFVKSAHEYSPSFILNNMPSTASTRPRTSLSTSSNEKNKSKTNFRKFVNSKKKKTYKLDNTKKKIVSMLTTLRKKKPVSSMKLLNKSMVKGIPIKIYLQIFQLKAMLSIFDTLTICASLLIALLITISICSNYLIFRSTLFTTYPLIIHVYTINRKFFYLTL
jgi:hypothetical protein